MNTIIYYVIMVLTLHMTLSKVLDPFLLSTTPKPILIIFFNDVPCSLIIIIKQNLLEKPGS